MIRHLAKRVLRNSGVLRLAARLHGKGVAILMYHSVVDDARPVDDSLGGIIHTRQVFQGQMDLLAREFRPVDLVRVQRFLTGDEKLPERAVAVTFDDGYTDNHEIAMPILDRLGIPATFYVTVDCVENRKLPWPSRLRYSFRRTKRKSWTDPEGKLWSMENADIREQAFLTACDRVCQLAGTALENCLTSLEEELEAKLPNDSSQLMMTWEQIRDLARHGHTVGSHTMTHPNMAYLRNEDATREFADSKKRIETQMNAPLEHFAYPCPALYPSWSQETVAGCRLAGYQTAVTTNRGLVRKGHEPLLLNRVRPSKTIDGLQWNLEKAFAGRAV
jgi:peptidoglycan/xylan/chitin deacetylase (PgdA/CDA1 family)